MSPISRLPIRGSRGTTKSLSYLRMLDANADSTDWREVSRIVLNINAGREPDPVRRAFDSERARQMDDAG
jgi:hypothetical protein